MEEHLGSIKGMLYDVTQFFLSGNYHICPSCFGFFLTVGNFPHSVLEAGSFLSNHLVVMFKLQFLHILAFLLSKKISVSFMLLFFFLFLIIKCLLSLGFVIIVLRKLNLKNKPLFYYFWLSAKNLNFCCPTLFSMYLYY